MQFWLFPSFCQEPISDIVPDVVYHLGRENNYPKYFTIIRRYYWEININGVLHRIFKKYNSECKDKTILKYRVFFPSAQLSFKREEKMYC